jgi:predicted enzyme related to lactoylglutathione lyase
MKQMNMTCVTFDCDDPAKMAQFWSDALRWSGTITAADGSSASCAPTERGMYLEFVHVPEAKVVKNRVHLGCTVEAVEDLDAEVERLLALGATFEWEEFFSPELATVYRNLVLRDPEGNEFCLGAGTPPQ